MVFPVVMYGCECWTVKKAEELMVLNCGVGEDSWESLAQFPYLWVPGLFPLHGLALLLLTSSLWLLYHHSEASTVSPGAHSWFPAKSPDLTFLGAPELPCSDKAQPSCDGSLSMQLSSCSLRCAYVAIFLQHPACPFYHLVASSRRFLTPVERGTTLRHHLLIPWLHCPWADISHPALPLSTRLSATLLF